MIKALCHSIVASPTLIGSLCINQQHAENILNISSVTLAESKDEIKDKQWNDPTLNPFILHFRDGIDLHRKQLVNADQIFLFRNLDSLILREGVLFRNKTVLSGIHDEVGHLGRNRSLQLARDRFFWPKMIKDIETYIKKCPRCLRRKSPKPLAPLVSISSSQPLELFCIDYLGLEPSKGGVENILVITDHFTRYSLAVPCKSTKAKPTAKILYDLFINHYVFQLDFTATRVDNLSQQLSRNFADLLE